MYGFKFGLKPLTCGLAEVIWRWIFISCCVLKLGCGRESPEAWPHWQPMVTGALLLVHAHGVDSSVRACILHTL